MEFQKNQPANARMVEYARQSRGLTQKELAEKLDITQGLLSKIEQGQYPIHDHILEKISTHLSYPTSFFFQNRYLLPPDLVHYRKRKSLQNSNLKFIDTTLNFRRWEVKTLLESLEVDSDVPTLSTREYGTPERVAALLRQHWKIPVGPIENLTKLIEDKGIIIFGNPDNDGKLDGMYVKDEDNVPFIFINTEMPPDRMRFTLAHELAHLVMHSHIILTAEEDAEDEANRFASEFLVPSDEFMAQMSGKFTSIPVLADQKRYWKVSIAALIRKAKDTGLINSARYEKLYAQLSREGYRKNEPLCGLLPEKPTLVSELVGTFLKELEYSEHELAAMIHLNFEEFLSIYRNNGSIRIVR